MNGCDPQTIRRCTLCVSSGPLKDVQPYSGRFHESRHLKSFPFNNCLFTEKEINHGELHSNRDTKPTKMSHVDGKVICLLTILSRTI